MTCLINGCFVGVMACPEGKTEDGFEAQFGTNHLGHFLLFQLLKATLLSSSSPAFNSRVVAVSSLGHRTSPVLFNDLHSNKGEGGYNTWVAYGQVCAPGWSRETGNSGETGHAELLCSRHRAMCSCAMVQSYSCNMAVSQWSSAVQMPSRAGPEASAACTCILVVDGLSEVQVLMALINLHCYRE